ncbi:hypothetical protein RIVM261_013230 [Rivularia sp. IAM M-261]|nr:hypothetical protein RIVM261_013230 [Rivularia sp. IAM M-261]
MKLDTIIAMGSLMIAFGSGLVSVLLWYANSEKQRYGFERDIGHLRRNQEQLQQGITTILAELDRRFDEIERQIGFRS